MRAPLWNFNHQKMSRPSDPGDVKQEENGSSRTYSQIAADHIRELGEISQVDPTPIPFFDTSP
jgi:hypothetical protein